MKPPKRRGGQPGGFFKPGRNATRKTTNLSATSHSTGITHEFTNIAGWEKIISDLETQRDIQVRDIMGALGFYNWLYPKTIDKVRLSVPFNGPGYRYANPKFGPLTIAGSLGDGGRFNPGSAQMHEKFPYVTKFGCLYIASSRECAEAEAAKPIGVHKMYEIKANRELMLWDIRAVIEDLDFVNLLEIVRESHGDRLWAFQKSPVHSQILGLKLKLSGGDGLIFESTKSEGHSNIALFFETDDEAKKTLIAREI